MSKGALPAALPATWLGLVLLVLPLFKSHAICSSLVYLACHISLYRLMLCASLCISLSCVLMLCASCYCLYTGSCCMPIWYWLMLFAYLVLDARRLMLYASSLLAQARAARLMCSGYALAGYASCCMPCWCSSRLMLCALPLIVMLYALSVLEQAHAVCLVRA